MVYCHPHFTCGETESQKECRAVAKVTELINCDVLYPTSVCLGYHSHLKPSLSKFGKFLFLKKFTVSPKCTHSCKCSVKTKPCSPLILLLIPNSWASSSATQILLLKEKILSLPRINQCWAKNNTETCQPVWHFPKVTSTSAPGLLMDTVPKAQHHTGFSFWIHAITKGFSRLHLLTYSVVCCLKGGLFSFPRRNVDLRRSFKGAWQE